MYYWTTFFAANIFNYSFWCFDIWTVLNFVFKLQSENLPCVTNLISITNCSEHLVRFKFSGAWLLTVTILTTWNVKLFSATVTEHNILHVKRERLTLWCKYYFSFYRFFSFHLSLLLVYKTFALFLIGWKAELHSKYLFCIFHRIWNIPPFNRLGFFLLFAKRHMVQNAKHLIFLFESSIWVSC